MSKFFPLLYEATESAFTGNGLGALSSAIDWNVYEKRNGKYELEMIYPITGINYSSIHLRSIIVAKPNPYDEPQPFRVYRITKPLNGKVKIYAKHLSYDVSGIPVGPFVAENVLYAVDSMNQNGMVPNPFTLHTDKSTVAEMINEIPTSFRALMGGNEGSILDIYGGEYYYDWYDIYLKNSRGEDRNVTIRFGKNLTDIELEEMCEDVYNGIIAYWRKTEIDPETEEEIKYYAQSDIIMLSENPEYYRIYMHDVTDQFDEQPTVETLNQVAEEYAIGVGLNIPSFSIELSYEQEPSVLEVVKLCDTVHVYVEKLEVDAEAKVVETCYNGPKDRFSSITLGSARSTFAQTLNEVISSNVSESRTEQILESREIIKRFEETINGIQMSISNNIDSIVELKAQVNGQYDSQGNMVQSGIIAQISEFNNALNAIFTSNEAFLEFKQGIESSISDVRQYTINQINGITTYVRFTNEPAVILGKSDSNCKLKFLNNQMFYYSGSDTVISSNGKDQNGNVVASVFAYFNNQELTVTTVNAVSGIRIGMDGDGTDYKLFKRANGHLTLKII